MKSADPEKSVIKTLMGTGPATPAVVEAVPPRPGSSKKSEETKSTATKSLPVSTATTRKSNSNLDAVKPGTSDSALNGTLDHADSEDETTVIAAAGKSANGTAAPGGSATHHSQQRNAQRNSQRARRRRKH
jgi:hypothetical protein